MVRSGKREEEGQKGPEFELGRTGANSGLVILLEVFVCKL